MQNTIDRFSNHIKNVTHGFFIAVGTTIAEPATILPLIVNYFGGSSLLVGFFAALLRGGAIFVQLFAAFHAQSYPYMMKYMRRVFAARFISWFFIGISIILFGKHNPNLTLLCIGIGLFFFSFSAGFGMIYFREIIAKSFSHNYRGKTMAYRQFFTAFGALISGAFAGYLLEIYEPPYSYGYLFIISTFIMTMGYLAFGSIKEPIKENVSQKEKSFRDFLKNAFYMLKLDKDLQIQVTTYLLAYGYLIALPFIILDAKQKIELSGAAIGSIITAQMVGAMLSNILWGKLTSRGFNKLTTNLALIMMLIAVLFAFNATTLIEYMIIFFIAGAANDGNRIASQNLIIKLAPEEKRPVYVALQANITSLGLFFSILGGFILQVSNYNLLYSFTFITILSAFILSLKLKDQ